MLEAVPREFERLPLLVNPIQFREAQPAAPRSPVRRAEPVAPIRAVPNRQDRMSRHPAAHPSLLSAETRRALLGLDPNHPAGDR